MFQNIRFISLTFAILMILTVSVHPAMAEMDVKDKTERTNAAIEQIKKAGLRCPGCEAGIANGTSGHMGNLTNVSLSIRQVSPEGGLDSENISGAEPISLPFGTMMVRPEGYTDPTQEATAQQEHVSLQEYGSVLGKVTDLQSAFRDTGTPAGPSLPENLQADEGGDRFKDGLRELERDPLVQNRIRLVTRDLNYDILTNYQIGNFSVPLISEETRENTITENHNLENGTITAYVSFIYSNITNGNRFWILAGQNVAANGTFLQPRKIIVNGTIWRTAVHEGKVENFDRDPAVRSYIRNVTMNWGYASRTGARIQRFSASLKGVEMPAGNAALFDVVTYEYTNISTNMRFKFAAGQAIAANGTALPPISVVPGREYPPLAEKKCSSFDCPDCTVFYGYLFLAIFILILAILLTIGLSMIITNSTLSGSGGGNGYFQPVSAKAGEGVEFDDSLVIFNRMVAKGIRPTQETLEKFITGNDYVDPLPPPVNWALTIVIYIILFLIVFCMIAAPLVGLALINLVGAIIAVLVCEQIVQDNYERANLGEILDPGSWIGVTEQDNGQPILVHRKGSMILIALNESKENGVQYMWKGTTTPSYDLGSTLVSYTSDPGTRVRLWMLIIPADSPTLFSARYVRADAPDGPAKKEFSTGFIPLSFEPTDSITADPSGSQAVGYGASIALDPKTDRMHMSYLDYSGPDEYAGKLMYRTGADGKWDEPVVVDGTIGWAPRIEGNEMARTTSIVLGPDGNPRISYMDWKAGHLKYAQLKPWEKGKPRPPGTHGNFQNRWDVETVDASSSYAGWGSSIAVDREGSPHISYLRQEGYFSRPDLKYAHRTATGWVTETVRSGIIGQPDEYKLWSPNVMDGAGTSIALDSYDRPHITYVDYAGDSSWAGERSYMNMQLEYASWNGSAWSTEPVDSDRWIFGGLYTRHGLYSSLAIDDNDHPHISYFSHWDDVCFNLPGWPLNHPPYICDYYLLGNLKYATSNGSVWSTEVVDDSNNAVGRSTSLRLDKAGRPHISYMDWKNGFVRYAEKHGVSWDKWVPDHKATGRELESGRSTSLALDSRGSPHIVYMDRWNGHWTYVRGDHPDLPTPAPTSIPTLMPTTVTPTNLTPSPTGTPGTGSFQSRSINPVPIAKETERVSPQPQSGNLAFIARESSAGEKVTYAFGNPSAVDPVSVQSVSIVPKESIPESRCVVRQESPSQGFRLHGGPAAYKNIEISWINPSLIADASIGFVVTRAWLDENHIDPADVVLMRQHDLKWTQLVTTFDHQAGDMYYYTAVTPGFSYFAVTDKKTASAATVLPTATITQSAEGQTALVTATASPTTTISLKAATGPSKPVVTMTGTPAPVPSTLVPETGTPVPGTGIPVLWLIAAGLVSMLLVAGFFIGRRLWWKHQNPKLFGRD